MADEGRRPAAAALLVYVSLAVLLTAEVWFASSTRWIGSCCDPEQTIWFLGWIPHAIQHGVDPFVTYQINAPAGANLMWNSSIPLISLAMTPVTLTAGPIVAYNLAIVGSIALSAWCTFLALRRYTSSTIAALIGGAVYGFSPYVTSHGALHLNLIAVWAPPLLLLLLDELLIRRQRSPTMLGATIGLVAAGQLLTSEEILATSAVAAVIFVGAAAAVLVRRRSDAAAAGRRLAEAFLPAGVLFTLVAAWPLAVQFFGPQRIAGPVQNLETFSTDLLNLLIPTSYQLFSPAGASNVSGEFSGLFHEATAYVGLPLLLFMAAFAGARWPDLRVRVAGLMAGTMFVVSLGPVLQIGSESTGVPMPWAPFSGLPLLEHALPGRFTLFMWLAIAAIVALMVDWLRGMRIRSAVPGLVALAAALAVAAPAPLGWSTTAVPVFFERWDRQGIPDDAIVLMAPYFTNGAGADPMLWAAVAGNNLRMYEAYAYVPLPDGRPSYGPPSTQLSNIMVEIQDHGTSLVARGAVRAQVGQDLATAGITHVIVGPTTYSSEMIAFFTDLFGRQPQLVDGVVLWRDVDRAGIAPVP